jgi:hypothetical protein
MGFVRIIADLDVGRVSVLLGEFAGNESVEVLSIAIPALTAIGLAVAFSVKTRFIVMFTG